MSKSKSKQESVAANEVCPAGCLQEVRRWYQTGPGQIASGGVQTAIEDMSNDVFGYHALQLGDLAEQYTLLKDSRISRCFNIAPDIVADAVGNSKVDLVADPAALPIEFDNIDLVVASHVLDCAPSPHQVLREIERVLMPEGHCILVGFNPFSVRGLRLFWRRMRKQVAAPAMYTSFRLRDWFSVLGFEVIEIRTVGFRTRLSEKSLFRRVRLLRFLIDKYCELFGSVQLVHVRKKVSKRILMKPRLRAKPLLKPGMAVSSSVGKTMKPMEQQQEGRE